MFERLYYREKVTSAYYCGWGAKANTYRFCGIPCEYRAYQTLVAGIQKRFDDFTYGQSFFLAARFHMCIWNANVTDWFCGRPQEDWEAWDV